MAPSPTDQHARQLKELASQVKKLRGWVASDPGKAEPLVDALNELTALRLVAHRHLEAAGGHGDLFTPEAKSAVFEHAQGIPRRINRLALEAVKLSARNKVTTIDEELICVAIRGVDGI